MGSVIEDEFLAAEERPIRVLERGAQFLGPGGFECVLEFQFFLGGRKTGERMEENFVDQFGCGLF